jgi:lipopolysaccharide transport system ATP-binding protein
VSSMSSTAIEVVGLGKQYRIGAPRVGGQNLRDAIVHAVSAPVRNLQRLREARRSNGGGGSPTIWALRDVSFAVRDGEVLGVVGRNGAGKSTLLKILSRITDPTTGHADVRGRVGSLLEVGTGFHPELTGRDNVFLNGSILGMDRAYIRHRFDEIVEFSGIGSFIDTPVKHYSSGMNVRLAFAVAAHLEPEVLIVDEVLAVGDAEFQQRCLGRMDQVARDGRTVLFVSHNLGAVQRLCTRCILLDGGQLVADADTTEVVRQYLAGGGSDAPAAQWIDLSAAPRGGSGGARLVALRYSSSDPAVDFRAYPGGPLEVSLKIHAATPLPRARIGFALRDQYGATLITASTYAIGSTASLPQGTSTWLFKLAELSLMPGTYQLSPSVYDSAGMLCDRLEPALRLEVFDRQVRAWGPRFDPRYDGIVRCDYEVTAVADDEPSVTESDLPDGRPGALARDPEAARTAV